MPSGFWVDSSLWQSKHYKAELIHSCISVLSTWKHYRDKKAAPHGFVLQPKNSLTRRLQPCLLECKGIYRHPEGK